MQLGTAASAVSPSAILSQKTTVPRLGLGCNARYGRRPRRIWRRLWRCGKGRRPQMIVATVGAGTLFGDQLANGLATVDRHLVCICKKKKYMPRSLGCTPSPNCPIGLSEFFRIASDVVPARQRTTICYSWKTQEASYLPLFRFFVFLRWDGWASSAGVGPVTTGCPALRSTS